MIYFTTGANGAGKTLFTLYDVREQSVKENRPVYYHGFEALEPIKQFGWKPFDPEKWQDLPDGSICIFDECQNEFPAKMKGEVPDWINAIAQFRRKRGFDFWLISPHPSLIHINVRRLIENPSWHRHMKRSMGTQMAAELKFNAPNMNCEKPGASASGQVSMRPYPKEVFTWYKSMSLDTAKVKIPWRLKLLIVIMVALPVLAYFGWSALQSNVTKRAKPQAEGKPAQMTQAAPEGPLTAAAYIDSYTPRLPGLPQTAPRYDAITQPTDAPYPAACVKMGERCQCYTQQSTKLPLPNDLCEAIVKNGYFKDWGTGNTTPNPAPVVHPQS